MTHVITVHQRESVASSYPPSGKAPTRDIGRTNSLLSNNQPPIWPWIDLRYWQNRLPVDQQLALTNSDFFVCLPASAIPTSQPLLTSVIHPWPHDPPSPHENAPAGRSASCSTRAPPTQGTPQARRFHVGFKQKPRLQRKQVEDTPSITCLFAETQQIWATTPAKKANKCRANCCNGAIC